jgi:phosphoribosylamine-glycine ligase
VLVGCRGTTEGFDANWDQKGGTFDPAERVALASARAKFAAGETEAARREFVDQQARDPENIEVGVWLQEVELALLAAAARGEVLAGVDKITWDGAFYRRDIAHRALARE